MPLGDLNPQTIKIDQQAVVYPGRDHVTVLTIKRYDGRSYRPVDTSALTRVVLVFPDTDPTTAYDSDTLPAVFSWTGSTITIDLSDYAMPASSLPCYLIAFDAEHSAGQVLVDNEDTTLEFDFRNVSTTGTTPAPAVEFVTDAPIDGETYGRKDGAWVTLDAIVSGVASVNGQTGVVNLSAADVGADPAGEAAAEVALHEAALDPHPQYLTETEGDARYEFGLVEGANITIDRTNPLAPVISSAGGGGGAVDSVNGQTGVVVLDAADVGADPAGSALNARFQSTGLISGGALSINGVDNTKFDVAAGVAVFADYTDPEESTATTLPFGPFTAVVVPNLASANASYVGINSAGAIVQQTTRFTNTQRRSIVSLGAVIHSNNTNLNAVNTIVSVNRQLLNQFGDGIRAIGQLNLSGTVYSSVGANLQMQRSAGELFSPGANFHVNPDDPHSASISAQNPVTFRYRLANGTEYTDRTLIDPANYDNAGVLTAVPANRYTVQLIAVFQSGITRMQYGQVLYTQLSDAVTAARQQSMTLEQNILDNGVLRGYLVVKGDATALDNTSQAVFITLSKFGASASVSPLAIATTDELAEGSTNLYFTAARVRNTILTGLSTATNMAITAVDTVLDAMGKLQAQITSHFGVGDSTHPAATTSVAGFQSAADKTKLDGIATGATANSTDAFLLARANHTGTQAASTISDFDSATRAQVEAELLAGTNITITPAGSGATRTLTIAASGGGGATLPVVQALSSTRNLGLADINTFNVNSTGTDYTVTIPPQSSVTWTADAEIHFLPTSTGNIVITGGTGVSVNGVSAGSTTLSTAYGAVSIKRIASDSWWVGGVTGQIGASADWAAGGGVANAYTLTPTVARESYVTGDYFRTRFSVTNTGATTVNVSGLGTKTCLTVTGAALPAGYIRTDADTELRYDGTNFIVDRLAETGSNANGRFWRYADGAQYCLNNAFGSLNCNTASGALFQSSADQTWTFPAAFAEGPVISGQGRNGRSIGLGTQSSTAVDVRNIASVSSATTLTTTLEANGVWYT